MKRKHKKGESIPVICVITALIMISLTGCGKEEKKVDYEIEGIVEEEPTQKAEGKSGLAQFEGEEVWKENLWAKIGESEYEGQTVDMKTEANVSAQIIVPQVKQMSVVEVEEPEFDAEFKEMIAKKIFDSGEIYYGDANHLPKKDLQAIQEYYNNPDRVISTAVLDFPIVYEEYDKEWRELWAAVENMENAKDTYTPVEEYTGKDYIGSFEDRMYELTFEEYPGANYSFSRLKRIVWEVKDFGQVCPENFKDEVSRICFPWTRGNWVENQCEISEEDALKEAKAIVEKLGLDYPVASYTYPLAWGTVPDNYSFLNEAESEAWEINGYVFSFDLGVDDLSFVNYGTEDDYRDFQSNTEVSEEFQYSLEARVQVYVTDQGVIKMIVNNPLEIIGVSEGVELLPLDTIKNIMRETLTEEYITLRLESHVTDFTEMELIYFRVRDKENPGKYSYVPAWRLGQVSKDTVLNEISIRNQVLINAIDGSVIYFYDET